jgi:hypothetical protein
MDIDLWQHSPFLDDTFPLPLDAPFTLADALAVGLPRRWLALLSAGGQLRHPVKGCYVPAQVPDTLETRAACLRLVSPPDAVVVDRHAGWLLGADMLLLPNEHLNLLPVQLYLPAGRGRLRNKLCDSGERSFGPEDLTEVHGLRVTTALRTALDLGRQRWPEPALTALDALHRLGHFSVEELLEETRRFRRMRWVTTLRLVAPHTDGRSQSGGETVIRWRWLHLPVPPPEPQVEVRHGGRTAFIDVGNPVVRGGVEFNGHEWHDDPVDRAADATRAQWLDEDGDWALDWLVSEEVYGRTARVEQAIMDVHAEARRRTRRRAA